MKNSSSPPLPRPCTFCHFATAVAIASLWICASSRAATYTYSPTDSLLDQWTTGTNWNATPVSNAATILVFGPSGSFSSALTNTSTNDFASPFQLNVLTLQGTGPTATGSPVAVTIVGGTLNFQSSPQINLNASNGAGTSTVSYTINSNISLSSPLTITGDGTAAFAFGGVISGSQSITKSGTSTVTLSGANSYTGTTTISAGTIKLGSAGNATNTPLGSASSTTRVTPGGTLDLDGYSLVAARPLALGQSGATSAAALINSSATAATYSGTISMADNFQQIGGAGDITATGIISGTGNWTKAGTNTLTLSASNTFSGNLFIDNGTVKLGAAGNATNSPLGTTGGYTLIGNAGTPATLDLNGFTLGTAETLYLNAAGGRLINSSATPVAYSGAVNINSPSVASIGGAGNLTLTGVLGGIGTLTKEGAGMLTLSAANTFRGTLVVSTGSLAVTNSLALQDTVLARNVGEGPVTFGGLPAVTIGGLTGSDSFDLDVSVFSIGGQTSSAFSGTLTGANGFTKSGSATLTLSGTSTYSGPTTVSSGMLSFLKPASLYNNTPGAWTATNLIVNSGATLAFGVGGAGSFATGDITVLSALGTGSGGFRNGSSLGLD
ncbi:MAG: autotransporter outer membrane beta-barrel domain-containing protein, partial [Chthoniobacterales bacterium]